MKENLVLTWFKRPSFIRDALNFLTVFCVVLFGFLFHDTSSFNLACEADIEKEHACALSETMIYIFETNWLKKWGSIYISALQAGLLTAGVLYLTGILKYRDSNSIVGEEKNKK